MLQTPKINQVVDEAADAFQPDKIWLVLFSQTRYENVMEKSKTCEACK